MSLFAILAQAATTQGSHPPAWYEAVHSWSFPLMIGVAVLWIFMLRGRRGDDKQKQDMLKNMKRGDRVQTIGGVLGTIVETRENEIVVKVDEGNNTKIKFLRSAIHKVVAEDKADSK